MKTILFLFISWGFLKAEACPFEGVSLGSLQEQAEFTTTESQPTPFPETLYLRYQSRLGALPLSECHDAVVASQIRMKATGKIFTAFYTNDDSCDGGNSYGMIVEGLEARADRAVASIEDSDILCLE